MRKAYGNLPRCFLTVARANPCPHRPSISRQPAWEPSPWVPIENLLCFRSVSAPCSRSDLGRALVLAGRVLRIIPDLHRRAQSHLGGLAVCISPVRQRIVAFASCTIRHIPSTWSLPAHIQIAFGQFCNNSFWMPCFLMAATAREIFD